MGSDSLLNSPNAGLDLSSIGKLYGDVSSTSKLIACDSKYYSSESKIYETRPSEYKYYGNSLQSSRSFSSDSRFGHCDSSSVKCETDDVPPPPPHSYHSYYGYDPSLPSHMVTHS
ncbi:hypothetical protein Phum_PHUM363260 [Pediculus humanus corporis]|uniref:Uncharacterized protein n=1 Tax=Pediculus humanus subsp. corporis TaxID=121224 RepID=E0VPQ9_PEDHC|nr:uncharacterized protein Phum_PHUM363260 [Pediculus humanus corporis]EEB15365.1 hypothetical protein Phum_PHUM363260 [Pediculus humanus corporis]